MKKVVIFPPTNLEEVAKTFVMLRKIEELYPEAELNLIGTSKNLLPYEVVSEKYRCFKIPEELNTRFGVYKFIYNLNDVFNIDTTIDLEGSPTTSIMGLTLRPERRIGWAKGKQRFLYTERVTETGYKDEKSFLKFIGIEEQENVEHINIYMNQSEQLKDLILKDFPEKIISLIPSSVMGAESKEREGVHQFYLDLITELEGYQLLLFVHEHELEVAKKSEELREMTHVKVVPQNPKILREALLSSSLTLSEFEWINNFLSLEGKYSCYIADKEQYLGPVFYKQKPAFLKLKGEDPEYFLNEQSERKDIIHVSHFVDFVTEILDTNEDGDEEGEGE